MYKTERTKSIRFSTHSYCLTFLLVVILCSLLINSTQHALAKSHSHGHKTTSTGGNSSSSTTSTNNFTSGTNPHLVINGGDSNSLAYENSALGVLLLYPHTWQVSQPNNSSVKFAIPVRNSSAGSQAYLELNMLDLQHWSAYAKKHPELISNSTLPSTISGIIAHMAEYSNGTGKDPHKLMQVWVVSNNQTVYLFTYSARPDSYSAFLPSIQKMINSFQIQTFNQWPVTISERLLRLIKRKQSFTGYQLTQSPVLI